MYKRISLIILLLILTLTSIQISIGVNLIDTGSEFLTVGDNDLQDNYINRQFRSNEEEIEALKVYEELYDYGWQNGTNDDETVSINRQRLLTELCGSAEDCEIKFSYTVVPSHYGYDSDRPFFSTQCNIPNSICEMSCSPETEEDPLRVSISRLYWTQWDGMFNRQEYHTRETLEPNYLYNDRNRINYEISNNIFGRWYILTKYISGFYPSISFIENSIKYGFLFREENMCNNNRIGAYTESTHITREEETFIEPENAWEEGTYETSAVPVYLSTLCSCGMFGGVDNQKKIVHLTVIKNP